MRSWRANGGAATDVIAYPTQALMDAVMTMDAESDRIRAEKAERDRRNAGKGG